LLIIQDFMDLFQMTYPPLWTAEHAALATQGRLVGCADWTAQALQFDTRHIRPGDLFLALPSAVLDRPGGMNFVESARQAGAVAAIVTDPLHGKVPEDFPRLVVPDTQAALEALGQWKRRHVAARFGGVTGSVGKTTTRGAWAHLCAALGPTHSTLGNFNNHIGLPFTLASTPLGSKSVIVEMGMNHAGEIERLTHQVRPDCAIITTIAAAHLEGLGSMEAIAEAKSEIFLSMAPGATAILPLDNPWFPLLKARAEARNLSIVTFGKHSDADMRWLGYEVSKDGRHQVRAAFRGVVCDYPCRLLGEGPAMNTMVALTAMAAWGEDWVSLAQHFDGYHAQAGRGTVHDFLYRLPDGSEVAGTVIDDSYNAPPVAVESAVHTLVTRAEFAGATPVVVLADLAELGTASDHWHEHIARTVLHAPIPFVVTVGPLMHTHMERQLGKTRHRYSYETTEEALEALPEWLGSMHRGSASPLMILLKGRHGAALHRLADRLRHQPALQPN
jgi:UDP-N-acetylmuramoyl-tripeptide--D-alanyl-D-alanine ligase